MSGGFSPVRDSVRIGVYEGSRQDLRPLFQLAEDSAAQLDSYLGSGRVLVAWLDDAAEGDANDGDRIVGHLQIVATGRHREVEIKNMAVRESCQGQGIGSALIRAALRLAQTESVQRVLVATATASIGNLRFYQRAGFRMQSIERDAFTPATGYPTPIHIDGIPLRDRVWLDRQLDAEAT